MNAQKFAEPTSCCLWSIQNNSKSCNKYGNLKFLAKQTMFTCCYPSSRWLVSPLLHPPEVLMSGVMMMRRRRKGRRLGDEEGEGQHLCLWQT